MENYRLKKVGRAIVDVVSYLPRVIYEIADSYPDGGFQLPKLQRREVNVVADQRREHQSRMQGTLLADSYRGAHSPLHSLPRGETVPISREDSRLELQRRLAESYNK